MKCRLLWMNEEPKLKGMESKGKEWLKHRKRRENRKGETDNETEVGSKQQNQNEIKEQIC